MIGLEQLENAYYTEWSLGQYDKSRCVICCSNKDKVNLYLVKLQYGVYGVYSLCEEVNHPIFLERIKLDEKEIFTLRVL